jgi:hypothetical protein
MSTSAYYDGFGFSLLNVARGLPVLFRATRIDDIGPSVGRVTAILPTLPGDPRAQELTCYESGRHCVRTREWYHHCTRRCTVGEYMPLMAELCTIYPNSDLYVVPRITLDHDFKRFCAAGRLCRETNMRFDLACSAVREILEEVIGAVAATPSA